MGFYSNFIIPHCIDFAMSGSTLAAYRQELLQNVSGDILEIGFGTGLNLPHYPESVARITTIDPNPGMQRLAQERITASDINVDFQILNGESLPIADASFDSIVCTWTLCSIPQASKAISEVYRLLKPNGKFFFIEHGLSPDQKIQTWQNRLTPIQKIIADGCHLNRNIEQIVVDKFQNVTIEQFYAPNLPKVIGYMYQGTATK